MRSWWTAALVLLAAGAAAVLRLGGGEPGEALIAVLAGLLALVLFSPPAFPRRPDRDRPVTVCHRPGCLYCLRLRAVLCARTGRARWGDIWADPEAAAYVRSVNGGDETVPTVVVDGVPRTSPAPALVRGALR